MCHSRNKHLVSRDDLLVINGQARHLVGNNNVNDIPGCRKTLLVITGHYQALLGKTEALQYLKVGQTVDASFKQALFFDRFEFRLHGL